MSEHAAGELRRAAAFRHVGHAEARPELGVVSRGVRMNTAGEAASAGRAVALAAEATRKLQNHRQESIIFRSMHACYYNGKYRELRFLEKTLLH